MEFEPPIKGVTPDTLVIEAVQFFKTLVGRAGLSLIRCSSMGLISQNHTPAFLIPILKYFNREFRFGEYTVAIAQK